MTPFQASPQSIINAARDLFVSERFADAFILLNESMPDTEQELKLSILKGQKTIVPSVSSGDAVDIIEDSDEDYKQLCQEVLENYDFLVDINDKLYQVNSMHKFDLSLFVSENPLFKAFQQSEGEPIRVAEYRFTDALLTIDSSMSQIMKAPYVMYHKGVFYALENFTRPHYKELCTIYDSATDAAAAYAKSWG